MTILNVFKHPRRFAAAAVLGVSFLAVGPTVLLSGAAQAATVSPAHVSQLSKCHCTSTPAPTTPPSTVLDPTKPDPTRMCGCKHHHPAPPPTTPAPSPQSPTPSPTTPAPGPSATTPAAVVPTPAGGANTGGGGSLNGGSNVPLAAGGGAAALAAAGIGFFAIKRWRKAQVPSA